MKSTETASAQWPLPSGVWQPSPSAPGFIPVATASGYPVAPAFFPTQWRLSMRYAHVPSAQQAMFPPEFGFHPETGVALQLRQPSVGSGDWAGPYSSADVSDNVSGLPQTGHNLLLSDDRARSTTDDPDARMSKPPPGEYEFFSLPCATDSALLLALEPRKGLVYCYFYAERQWVRIPPQEALLNECPHLPDRAWRAVMVTVNASQRRLFLPTQDGLACLEVDAPALHYRVRHLGQGQVVGAPIEWGGKIWALLAQGPQLQVLSCTPAGEDIALLDVPALSSGSAAINPDSFLSQMPPITESRTLVWLSTAGQICLQLHGSGDIRAKVLAWPVWLQPQFEFGPPCRPNDGNLWHLCQDPETRKYHYLKLLHTTVEAEFAERPRLSIGHINYRYKQRQKTAPWEEPTAGDDGAQTGIFIPLLATSVHDQVLGLQLESGSQGLADVLRSRERQRALLTLDVGRLIAFGEMTVRVPWSLRCFVHNHFLWVFHPDLNDIQGWELHREDAI